jgi:hypothetical protein
MYIVTCYDTGVRCLQVILTPTCRVSGYPRQVIRVDVVLRRLRFICTALPTVITLITIIALGTYNTSSWYIFLFPTSSSLFFDDRCLLESLLTRLLPFTAVLFYSTSFYYSGSFSAVCSPFITLDSLDRRHHVQLFRCWFNAFNCCESVFLFVERFPG